MVLPVKPSIRPALVLAALSSAAQSSRDVLDDPKPVVSVRRATNDAIEYEIVCYVSELGKKIAVRNDLFDLAHRHLLSRGVVLRPLSVPEPVTGGTADEKLRLLRNVLIFQTLALVCDSVWALAAGTARAWFARSPRRISTLSGAGGVMMIGLGGVLAVSGSKS